MVSITYLMTTFNIWCNIQCFLSRKICTRCVRKVLGQVRKTKKLTCDQNKFYIVENRTRKSKTEAVLQRRSMLKLGVICKFIKRYGKCFMS